jgi:exopolysaccharide production protein ExoQ
MTEVLVAIGCFLTFFANVGSVGTAVQVAALGLLAAAAGYAVLQNKVTASSMSWTELTMYAVGVVSSVLGMLGTEIGPLIYSLGFLSAIILISIVSRSIPLERFLDIGAAVTLLCVLTTIAIERGNVVTSLSITVGKSGLVRLYSLGNHPNLTGYIFGAGSILMIRRALISDRIVERILMVGGALFAWAFTLAASARSSILALFVAGLVAVILELRMSRAAGLKWMAIGAIAAVVIGVAFPDKIITYFSRMLELESDTRGIASGGSGRVDLWGRGLGALVDDPITFAFGGGFRSSSSDVIGFSTESSYITILLDCGIFVGCAVIFAFICAPIKALSLSSSQNPRSNSLVLLASFLTFLIAESVFNRYLLAVGNPISLITLPILFSLSMRAKLDNARIKDAVPRTWGPPGGKSSEARLQSGIERSVGGDAPRRRAER